MDQFQIGEQAIETFEQIHGLNITIHDLSGTLSCFLKPHHSFHRSLQCQAVKAQGHYAACRQFDQECLRKDLANLPDGRIHICHAGLVEWVVPVFEKDQLKWILFAGPRTQGKHLSSAVKPPLTRGRKSPLSSGAPRMEVVEEAEAQRILEHLRQLAARLQKWIGDMKSSNVRNDGSQPYFANTVAVRETVIRRFIERLYAEPATLAMLAKKLCLSESRTSHVVRKTCGTTFRELLVQKRLHVATELLRQSNMSVLEVALASGFEDVTHFHRLFRRRIGTTPARYRITGTD